MNSFLYNHLKYQIAALIFMTILEFIYFIRPKTKTLSTKLFTILMISSYCYLLFDVATVFALCFFNKCPLWLTRFTHQGFVFFLDTALLSIYLFLDFSCRTHKRYYRRKLLSVGIVYIASILLTITLPLNYYIDENKIYSYGLMADSVYAIIIFFSLLTIIKAFKTLKIKEYKRQATYVLATMFLWVAFGIIQIWKPEILISSIAISSMILLMLFSLENPSEYIDKDTQSFNFSALRLVLFESISKKKPFTIINIDLEDLSIIENQLGDESANQILVLIREYLEKEFKFQSYRLNKNSMTFIVPNKLIEKTDEILNRLTERFHDNWEIRESSIRLNAHLDVIQCPKDFSYDGKISDLMDFVEDCHTYSNSIQFIRKVDNSVLENRNRKMTIVKLLNEAIERDEIDIFYQPIFNLEDGKFTNAEALVRLKNNSTLGYVSPEEFIPVAEKNGIIMKLSNKIFQHVFYFMATNNLAEKGIKNIEINLSGLQSVDADLPKLMKSMLSQYSIDPETVNLEITESIAISSGYMLKKNMDELKKIGCSFSMDDFGTGYSNLSQIAKVNFEVIKIDKSLLWPCFEKNNPDLKNAQILLENMIEMILQMGRKIVVEGIETEEQFNYLKTLDVTYIQGFYFSKPLPEKEFLEFLKLHN